MSTSTRSCAWPARRPRSPTDGVAVPAPVVAPGRTVTVAVAAGAAFTFTYADTLDALAAAGAEVVPFDPARDAALPDGVAGLVAGGGFPEVHAADLAANAPLLADVRARVAAGLPTWAECGGLLWLCRTLDGAPMVGAVPADGRMTDRLTLGYRDGRRPRRRRRSDRRARRCAGHEFHYSTVEPAGDALRLSSPLGAAGATGSPRRRCSPPTCTTTPAATRRPSPRSPAPVRPPRP